MGDWPAIVAVEQWEAVMATIAGRKKNTKPDTTTKYLLSGIARCARCGYRMHGAPVWQKSRNGGPSKKTDRYAYTCLKRHADQCGKMQIVGMPVDEMVRNLVWGVVERSLVGQEVRQETTWPRQQELDEVEVEIRALKKKWDAREIRASIYVSTLEALETDRDSLKADRALFMTAAIPVSRDDVIKKGWAGLSLERQREVVRSVLSAVLVHPAKSRGANFDAARVEPVFK
jgi:hypothetical protein